MLWHCGQFRFEFPRPALVMGVVNVTPDSFSDGGEFLEPAAAIAHAEQLVAEGADLIDIGGESTRPGAAAVSEKEELYRVLPVLEGLAGRIRVPISIDTQKPAVARAALSAGASIVNDIAANRTEPAMWRVVAECDAGYVCMHMQGTPATMQKQAAYRDVVTEVRTFLGDRLHGLAGSGVRAEQVLLDPGFGFGKSAVHNLELLAGLAEFKSLGRPLLIGISRKSFIGRILGGNESQRLAGGLACTVWAATLGVQVFRTHDVAATSQALRMLEAIRTHSR